MIVGSPFLIAGSNPSAVLEPIEQPLHLVALPIRRVVEARGAALVALGGNDYPDTPATQSCPHGPAAVALVAHQSSRPQPGSSTSSPLDGAARRQRRHHGLVVAFPSRQDKDDRLALSFGPDMDLGAEATA